MVAPFLPQMHGARRFRPRGLARLGNHGSGRTQSFVGALLLALPLLLTLHALDEDPPHDRPQPPIDAMISRDNARTFYPLSNELHARASALYEFYIVLDAL